MAITPAIKKNNPKSNNKKAKGFVMVRRRIRIRVLINDTSKSISVDRLLLQLF